MRWQAQSPHRVGLTFPIPYYIAGPVWAHPPPIQTLWWSRSVPSLLFQPPASFPLQLVSVTLGVSQVVGAAGSHFPLWPAPEAPLCGWRRGLCVPEGLY